MTTEQFEEIIKDVIGIHIGANGLTPMDYSECKACMKEAWNKAIEAADNASTESILKDGYVINVVDKESILKLKV